MQQFCLFEDKQESWIISVLYRWLLRKKEIDIKYMLRMQNTASQWRNVWSSGISKTKTSLFHICVRQCSSALYTSSRILPVIPVNPSKQHGGVGFRPKHCQSVSARFKKLWRSSCAFKPKASCRRRAQQARFDDFHFRTPSTQIFGKVLISSTNPQISEPLQNVFPLPIIVSLLTLTVSCHFSSLFSDDECNDAFEFVHLRCLFSQNIMNEWKLLCIFCSLRIATHAGTRGPQLFSEVFTFSQGMFRAWLLITLTRFTKISSRHCH